jgi:hypothetical protein
LLILRIILRPSGDPSRERVLEEVTVTETFEVHLDDPLLERYLIEHGQPDRRTRESLYLQPQGYLHKAWSVLKHLWRQRSGSHE